MVQSLKYEEPLPACIAFYYGVALYKAEQEKLGLQFIINSAKKGFNEAQQYIEYKYDIHVDSSSDDEEVVTQILD